MPSPFLEQLFGNGSRRLVESIVPQRTFDDVVLPEPTRQALERALQQVRKRDLLFESWGLAERHRTGVGLAFNFAGPPGTGKTICAEAVAHALGKRLLVVRYSELESQWLGQSAKNVATLFRAAREEDAVLFFDEADAVAARRLSGGLRGAERELNAVVSVLLRELEAFPGVVIFATNLAANFDPAFERRLRAHVLFERPEAALRERIWRAQLHPTKTPLGADVDFAALGARYDLAGGDIQNAVLKAAQAAASEPGDDGVKRIHQRHFEASAEEVLAGRAVMAQSLFADGEAAATVEQRQAAELAGTLEGLQARWARGLALVVALAASALLVGAVALAVALVR